MICILPSVSVNRMLIAEQESVVQMAHQKSAVVRQRLIAVLVVLNLQSMNGNSLLVMTPSVQIVNRPSVVMVVVAQLLRTAKI